MCYLCQQHFTTPRRLREHIPQHYIMTFCPCEEYNYHRHYILRHQRTMNCFPSYIFDVDEPSYPWFLELIQPFVLDKTKLERLLQGFPASRPITHGPVLKPPNYRKPGATRQERRPFLLPHSLPRVILQQVETESFRPRRTRRSPSPLPPPQQKRR